MLVSVPADALQVSRLIPDTPAHEGVEHEEQRYNAVRAVISEGRTVTQVARDWNVCRQTLHYWLGRYEEAGLEGLANHSHRPAHCPHQMPAAVE
jgi:transposase-like protein